MATSKVRILRLLEYVYEDGERAQQDMQGWHVPAQGRGTNDAIPRDIVIRSGIVIVPFDPDLDDDGVAFARLTAVPEAPPLKSYQEQRAEAEATGKLPEDAVHYSVDDTVTVD